MPTSPRSAACISGVTPVSSSCCATRSDTAAAPPRFLLPRSSVNCRRRECQWLVSMASVVVRWKQLFEPAVLDDCRNNLHIPTPDGVQQILLFDCQPRLLLATLGRFITHDQRIHSHAAERLAIEQKKPGYFAIDETKTQSFESQL